MRVRCGLMVFTSVAVLGLVGSTRAGDAHEGADKNYPGAACRAETNRVQQGGSKGERPMLVICPIVRGNVLPSPSVDASVTGSPDLDCRFWRTDRVGVPAASVGYSNYEDFSPTIRKFYYILDRDHTPSDDTFAFRCTLKPGQLIIQYDIGGQTQNS